MKIVRLVIVGSKSFKDKVMKKNLNFLEEFEEYAIRNRLLKSGEKILVGFSGGSDSTALLLALWHLKSKYGYSLIAAHVNYNLRGEDSIKDEEFVKEFCFKRNISLVIHNIKIDTKSNLENQAREIRFTYFNKLINLYNAQKIALGHNKEDQAETIIYRMFRGSGYTGMKGISPKSGTLIHPLLCFSRNEITEYLSQEDIQWREDLSNKESTFTRNKIRNEMLPWITENLNPKVINKLYNASEIFSETDYILHEMAKRRLLTAQIKHTKNEYRFSLSVIKKTLPVLRFYIYKEVYSKLNNNEQDFYHNNFNEIEAILNSDGSKRITLPHDIYVFKEYNELIFTDKDYSKGFDIENSKEITSLRNRLTFEDCRIIMKKLKKLPQKRYLYEDRYTAYIDLDKTSFPLIIRHRQPGDKFSPLGMIHTKKLKDFFIDEKVPKFERDKVLLFCDNEKIIWVAGHRIDNRVSTSSETKNILMLKVEKMAIKKARAAERIKKR